MGIDEVVKRIVERQAEAPENRSLLVGISGIDGCGKGYIAAQIEPRLAQHAVTSAVINVDVWLLIPQLLLVHHHILPGHRILPSSHANYWYPKRA
jgi:uridine kinase